MSEPMSAGWLQEIDERAAHLFEYVTLPSEAEQLVGVDVPALLAEVDRLRGERDRARTDAKHWRDTYQQDANAFDEFLSDLLDLLPGADDIGSDAYDQIPRGIKALHTTVERLRAELAAEQQRADTRRTELLDERDEALDSLGDVTAEADQLAAKVKRVRDLHRPVTKSTEGPYLDDDKNVQVCAACDSVREQLAEHTPLILWPCSTIRALDGES